MDMYLETVSDSTTASILRDMKDVIGGYAVSSKVGEDVFAMHKDSAKGKTIDEFNREWLTHEIGYVYEMFPSHIVEAYIKKPDGTHKFNAFTCAEEVARDEGLHYTMRRGKAFVHVLPGAYKTSKSVIQRAIENNINMDGMGKTAIEKALSAKRTPKDTYSLAWEKVKWIANNKPLLTETQWSNIKEAMENM